MCACVRVCVCACVRACVCACVWAADGGTSPLPVRLFADADYRGNVGVILFNFSDNDFHGESLSLVLGC